MQRPIACFVTVAFSAFAIAQDAEWIQDFAKAKATAKAEKKDLLIDFTGSDWCGWCIKLDEEVFSKDEFKKEAPKHFVLVKLDFPRNKELVTDAIRKQNEELGSKYQIQGYPTILLTDCEGRVYAATGYQEGGADRYNTHLGDLKKKGEAFGAAMAKADATKGADRAKALDTALSALEAEVVATHHVAILEEICTLDADGKAGVKAKYEEQLKAAKEAASERAAEEAVQKEVSELQEAISGFMEKKEFDKALAKLDETIQKPKNPTQHQLALFFKGMVIMDAKEDAKAAIAELEAAKKLAPESPIGKQIGMILPKLQEMAKQKEGEKKDEPKQPEAPKKEGGK